MSKRRTGKALKSRLHLVWRRTQAKHLSTGLLARSIDAFLINDAIALTLVARDASGQLILDQRTGDHAVHVNTIVIAEDGLDVGLEFLSGQFVNEVHRATNRVTAVQGALRPPQNFDALQIPEAAGRRNVKIF